MYKSDSEIDAKHHNWSFISEQKNSSETFEKTLLKKVLKEASIIIGGVEFVSRNCYHARLTDDNVNNIKRDEKQLLNFFTLAEIQKLPLTAPTKDFVAKFGSLI